MIGFPAKILAESHEEFLKSGGELLIDKKTEAQVLSVLVFILKFLVLDDVPEIVSALMLQALKLAGLSMDEGDQWLSILKQLKKTLKQFGLEDEFLKGIEDYTKQHGMDKLPELWKTL